MDNKSNSSYLQI